MLNGYAVGVIVDYADMTQNVWTHFALLWATSKDTFMVLDSSYMYQIMQIV